MCAVNVDKLKNRSFCACCSELIEFRGVLIVLNLEDFLRTIKSLFVNNMRNNKNKNDKNNF